MSCGKPCVWFSKKRCKQCATVEDVLAREEKINDRIIEEEDLSGLIADADAIFSKYIRLKYADKKGVVKCYTCDVKKHWTLMQCGHYIKRGHLYTRHDERNCRPQESWCNEAKKGNLAVFAQNLESETPGITDILREEVAVVYKPTREELRQVIAEYTPKVKSLLTKLK